MKIPLYAAAMFRRLALVAVALGLVACSNCDRECKEGITFYVAEVAGALSRGGEVPLQICFDGSVPRRHDHP